MEPSTIDRYKEDLLIERIATIFGFERLSKILPRDIPPSYLLVFTALFLQIGVLDTYNYAIADKNSIVTDPGRIFMAIGAVLAVVGVRWMRDQYAHAVSALEIPQRDNERATDFEDSFRTIVSFRTKLAVYLVALVFYVLNFVFLLGVSTAVEIEGLPRVLVVNLGISPLVMVPLIVEFGLMYLGIHTLLPRRIAKADLNLFFYDPQNMGGFSAVGQLFKQSYYLYTAGLLVYFGMVYWPLILTDIFKIQHEYPSPDVLLAVYFSILWFVGVLSIAYSMYRTHTLMSEKKDQAIRKLEAEIKDNLDAPFDIHADHLDDPNQREEINHKIAQIRETKRYPSTFTMWSQIAISVLLPQALQIALQVAP
jgi:TRAP-type C4-dicarboxylate transport system permease small subunit